MLRKLAELFPQAIVVLMLGKDGALGKEPSGPIIYQPIFPAEEVGRLGVGDAFAAGLLYSVISQEHLKFDLGLALRWGAAMAALKYSITGDIPVITQSEVETLVKQEPDKQAQRWR